MPETFDIAFGEFLPDAPDYSNPGCTEAHNVVPTSGGYGPTRGAGTSTGSASGPCLGAKQIFRNDGTPVTVGGTQTSLFVIVSGTTTETVVPSIGNNQYWQFQQFGRRVFAVGGAALYQITDIDSVTAWASVAGAPSGATAIGQVGQHLLLGGFASNPYQLQWSGLNDPVTFASTATNLAGTAEIQHEYGAITAIAGDRYPLVFQERGVSRIDPVGPPSVFSISTIEEARGSIAPNSVVSVGFITFFVAHDGFWATNGAATQPIGTNKVNERFRQDVSDVNSFRTHGAVDWNSQAVFWTYYPKAFDAFQKHLIYSFSQNRWSEATFTVDYLVEGAVDGVTLDSLDTPYPILDEMPISLDSAQFLPQGQRLSAFIRNGAASDLSPLDGDTREARFRTGEFQLKPGWRTYIDELYPIVENSAENSVGQLFTRKPKGGTVAASPAAPVNDAGFCPVRAEGLYMAAGLTIPEGATWSKAQGVHLEGQLSGRI